MNRRDRKKLAREEFYNTQRTPPPKDFEFRVVPKHEIDYILGNLQKDCNHENTHRITLEIVKCEYCGKYIYIQL